MRDSRYGLRVAGCGSFDCGFGISNFGLEKDELRGAGRGKEFQVNVINLTSTFLWNFFQVGWEAVRSMYSNMTNGDKHHTYSTFRDGILRLIIRNANDSE